MKIKYDIVLINHINLFEKVTNVKAKDCFINDNLTFIANKGQMGKAIGKKGSNIKRLEAMLKRKIRIVEFDDDVTKLISNLILPNKAKSITKEENDVTIEAENTATKAQLIGRDRKNIKKLQEIISRYFNVNIKIA